MSYVFPDVSPTTVGRIKIFIYNNKKFWEELICLFSLHKLRVNNIQCHHLHTKFNPNPPVGSKVIKGFFCTHLRSLNVCHFRMDEASRLKIRYRDHLQRHDLPTEFYENPLIGSKIISGGHTDRLVIS
jgi:hypothetical protein